MSYFVFDNNIFSRFDMYKFFLKETPDYIDDKRVCTFEEYYQLEKYFAKLYNCDCSDCGGPDVSRKCNVETVFREIVGGNIQYENIV